MGAKVPAEMQTGMMWKSVLIVSLERSPTEADYSVKHQTAEVNRVKLRLQAFTQSQNAVWALVCVDSLLVKQSKPNLFFASQDWRQQS